MSRVPFSTGLKVADEARKTTRSRLQMETYRRKARSVVTRLRRQQRTESGNETRSILEKKKQLLQREHGALEHLRYQARFADSLSRRQEALEGLVMLDRYAEATLETLAQSLEDPATEVRVKTIDLLATYPSPLPEPLIKRLIELVWDKEASVRLSAVQALAHHPDPRALGPLVGLLGTRDEKLRVIVEESLAQISDQLGPPPPITDGDT